MVSKAYSLRDTINTLKEHRNKLEVQFGKSKMEQLLFNLEEISLDLESISEQLIDVATGKANLEKLPEIFDFFQYGSIPHILGHLETIEQLLENNQNESQANMAGIVAGTDKRT